MKEYIIPLLMVIAVTLALWINISRVSSIECYRGYTKAMYIYSDNKTCDFYIQECKADGKEVKIIEEVSCIKGLVR